MYVRSSRTNMCVCVCVSGCLCVCVCVCVCACVLLVCDAADDLGTPDTACAGLLRGDTQLNFPTKVSSHSSRGMAGCSWSLGLAASVEVYVRPIGLVGDNFGHLASRQGVRCFQWPCWGGGGRCRRCERRGRRCVHRSAGTCGALVARTISQSCHSNHRTHNRQSRCVLNMLQ